MKIFYGADPNHFGELRLPHAPAPHPLVIFIHGGFWRSRFDLTHADAHCEALTRLGLATWNLEYRRIGQLGGGWPNTATDALAGVNHAAALCAAHHLDPTRVVLSGHSAGGHLALWVAAQTRCSFVAWPRWQLFPTCGVHGISS